MRKLDMCTIMLTAPVHFLPSRAFVAECIMIVVTVFLLLSLSNVLFYCLVSCLIVVRLSNSILSVQTIKNFPQSMYFILYWSCSITGLPSLGFMEWYYAFSYTLYYTIAGLPIKAQLLQIFTVAFLFS